MTTAMSPPHHRLGIRCDHWLDVMDELNIGAFVADGALDFDAGGLPTNPHSGMLSHAYVLGSAHVVESVRQLRGESTSQVEGAEVCLVTSAACVPSSAVMLGRR